MEGYKYSVCTLVISFTALALFVSGCTNINTTSYFAPIKTKLRDFQAVQFETLETQIKDFPKDALTKIPVKAASLLASENKFKEVKYGEIDNIPAEDTIVLLGEVTDYRPSSQFSFEGGGLKFGEVSISIKLALVNKATGDEIATGEINGYSSTGFMAKDIFQSMAEEVIKYVNESY
ncbi:MAG: hypothetical protein ACHQ6U_04885 [Thermodesulfobacteriota bacterium]